MPRLYLTEIEKASSTLAAALKALLGDRPLRAKRAAGCCGRNTDQIVTNLVDALAALKLQFTDKDRLSISIVGGGGEAAIYSSRDIYTDRVLNLLKKICGVKVQKLFLTPEIRDSVRRIKRKAERRVREKSNCAGILKLWIEAEVLHEQVEEIIQAGGEVKSGFSTMIGGKIESFDGLLKWLDKFYAVNLSRNLWLQRFRALQDRLAAVKVGLEMSGGSADSGKKEAQDLIDKADGRIAATRSQLPAVVSEVGLSMLQEQRTIFININSAVAKYRRVFFLNCHAGVNLGDVVIKEMIQRTQELFDLLKEHGERLWASYAKYMLETSGETSGDFLSSAEITAKVTGLLDKLEQQLRILKDKAGLPIQVGLSVPSSAATDEVIASVADFLQEIEGSVSTIQVAPLVPVTPVEPSAVNLSVVPDVSAEPVVEAEKAPVSAVSEGGVISSKVSAEPSAVHVAFFPKSSADLAAEQNARINVFIERLAAAHKEGDPFSGTQLDLAREFMAKLLRRNAGNVTVAVSLLADKLSVLPQWFEDTGLKAELGQLLTPAIDAPSLK